MKIPCSIILDLLPTYTDGLCSEESNALVNTHLENCDTCREIYLASREPLALDSVKKRENIDAADPMKKIRIKYVHRTFIVIACTIFLCLTPFFLDQIEPIRNVFHPSQTAFVHIEDTQDSWIKISFEKGNLIFDSPFYEKKVINHANSHDVLAIRIVDQEGNMILAETSVNPGYSVPLPLNSEQEYIVEVKAKPGNYVVVFI